MAGGEGQAGAGSTRPDAGVESVRPDELLLVPATRALLEGWCGPVLAEDSEGNWSPVVSVAMAKLDALAAWVVDLDLGTLDERAYEIAEDCDGHIADLVSFVHLALDLSRAECRDRVARVLADTARSPHGGTSGSCNGVQWLCRVGKNSGDWILFGDGDLRFCAPEYALDDGIPIPALANLDAAGDARLPDGSRWVDAAALAAVAREVLR